MIKITKIKFSVITFIIFLTLSTISNYNISSNQENDDDLLEIREETNLRTAAPPIVLLSPEDKIYAGPMSGYYPATYGFENDKVGAVPADWTCSNQVDNWANIIPEIDGHSHVLAHYDNTSSDEAYACTTLFPSRSSGTVEFYIRSTDVSKQFSFFLANGLFNRIITFTINDSKFYEQFRMKHYIVRRCHVPKYRYTHWSI